MAESPETPATPTGYPCPKCGEMVEYFVDRYFGRVACPKCGEVLSRKELSPDILVKRIKKAKRVEEARGERRRRRREEEKGLFKRAKTASEVLEDVLADHSLKSDFIDYATKRSERLGGIHPNELWNMLSDMSSGVKSKSHIKYIVDDYYYALQQEQEKARQMGARVSYPLRFGREAETVGPYPERFGYEEPYGPMYPPSPYRTRKGYTPPRGYRQAFGWQPPPLSKDDIEEIFERRFEEKAKRDELTKLSEKVADMPEQTRKMVEDTIEKLKPKEPATPPNVITAEQLEKNMENMMKTWSETLKERDTNAYIKYLESHSKDLKDIQEKTLEAYKEDRKEWAEERKKILEKIEEGKKYVPPSTEGYRRDETRLLADGVQILGQKSPLKELGGIFIQFMKKPGEETPPEREKVPGKTSILDLVPKEYIEE